jgi:hypothetical protein
MPSGNEHRENFFHGVLLSCGQCCPQDSLVLHGGRRITYQNSVVIFLLIGYIQESPDFISRKLPVGRFACKIYFKKFLIVK